jgi:hypothetical protein
VLAGIAVGAYAPAERILCQALVLLGFIGLMLPLYIAPMRNRVLLLIGSLIASVSLTSVNIAFAPIGPGLTLFFILAGRVKTIDSQSAN